MRPKIKRKVNWEKAKKVAYETLEIHGIKDFPIDLFELFNDYDNLTVISYGEIMEKMNLTREQVIKNNCSTEGSIAYDAVSDHYIIAFNEEKESKERVYWTLAHEFGHYLMQHNKEKKQARLSRLSLKKDDYDSYEAEADFFARFFLSPPPLIVEAKINNIQKIHDFFGVSYAVASNTLDYIQRSYKKGFRFVIPNNLRNYLTPFIQKIVYGKTCSNCDTFSYLKDSKFCPICGNSEFHNFYRGVDIVIYPGVTTNDFYVAEKCPKCQNDKPSNIYCQICGTYLLNKCSGLDLGESEFYQSRIKWHEQKGCGEFLNGEARFCHLCGSTSTFFEENILESWEEVQKRRQNNDPFTDSNKTPVAVDDDDLPF